MNGPKPTKAEAARINKMHELGCIACIHEGRERVPSQIHHIKQKDHKMTIPLCPWHHDGIQVYPFDQMTPRAMVEFVGPSLAKQKKAFVARYGTELELLEKVNLLINGL